MPYIGNQHNVGDHVNNFKVLDDISSHTATFDGSATSVVSAADDTIRIPEHRFIQGQRVTYTNGGGGNIGGLTTGTAYFVSFDSANTIKLATTLANANSNTVINISAVGSGTSHTLNAAFDGVNTKFKMTYSSGKSARLNNATQLNVAINNVIQRPNQSALSFTEGFAIEDNHKIVFKVAPTVNDIFWGSIIANTIENFDLRDNEVDNFTGDGSTTEFTLSTIPANNESVVVSINGVVQHPSDKNTARSYTLIDSIIQFTAAPALNDEIQVRHIGFAGASTNDVSGFYGRTGNVALTANDHITTGDITARNINASGILTASSASFGGNVSIGGTLTYEDVTNIDSVGIITARNGIDCNGDIDVEGHTNLDNVSVAGVSTFSDNVRIVDNKSLLIGDLSNGDLSLVHDGNNSVIRNRTGDLYISNATQTGFFLSGSTGDVRLNYGGDLKLETESTGVKVTGKLRTTGDLDIDGHTNLDNVSIAGVTTATGKLITLDTITTGIGYAHAGNAQLWVERDGINLSTEYSAEDQNTNAHICLAGENAHVRLQMGTEDVSPFSGWIQASYDNTPDNAGTGASGITGLKLNPQGGTVSTGAGLNVAGNIQAGGLTILDQQPKIYLTDNAGGTNDPDYLIQVDGGQFLIYDVTNTSNKILINADGHIDILPNTDFGAGIDVTGNITATGQVFSSYATLSAVNPTLTFADTDNNPDYTINLNSGILKITDSTNTADRLVVNSTGVSIPNDLDVDGHTNLDNVSIAGVTTTGNLYADNLYAQSSLSINNNSNVSINLTSTSTSGSSRIFFGDPDSALVGRLTYSHNGDYMQFFTAYGERLRITSDGKIGIGDDDPEDNHVLIRGSSTVRTKSGHIMLTGDSATINEGPQIVFSESGGGSSYAGGSIGFERKGTNSIGDLVFGTRQSSGNANTTTTEALRITSNGKVGVGDFTSGTAVSQALHVKGSQPEIYLEHTGGYDMTLTTNDGAGNNGITVNGGALSLAYNNKNIWMCRTGGYVAMGHMSPSTRLDVKQNNGVAYNNRAQSVAYGAARFFNESGHQSGGTYTGFQFNLTGDSQNRICAIGMISEASNNRSSSLVFATDDGGNRNEKLRITSAGLVGVNNTDPEGKGIDVANSRTNGYSATTDTRNLAHIIARNSSDGAGRFAALSFINGGATQAEGSINLVQTGNYTGDLTFKIRTAVSSWQERLRITSRGDIGLGTVPETDSYQPSLYFAGGNANIWGSGNANLYAAVNARYTGAGGWKYNNNGVASYVGQQSGVWNFFSAPSGTADATATFTERFRIDSQGNVKSGTVSSAFNFTDSNSGNTKSIEIGATGGGDALFVTHSSGYGVGYFGYEAGGDRLVIATDGGGGNNKIDFITDAGTSTGGGADNLNGKVPKMRISAAGIVTKPKNPAFKSNQTGTYGGVGSLTTTVANVGILQAGEQYDHGGNYSTSTYLFTCPVDGVYLVNVIVSLGAVGTGRHIFVMSYTNGGGSPPLQNYVEVIDGSVSNYANYSYCEPWYFTSGTTIGVGKNSHSGYNNNYQMKWGVHLLG